MCRLIFYILVCCLPLQVLAQAEFVGSENCTECHQQESENWQQSHHWNSMQEATIDSVLGNFENAEFDYFGTVSTFFRRDDRFLVQTDNSAGELEEFEIKYTFGLDPLQQYLVEFPDGRLQTLSISWDSREQAEGGQRWYHLYPDEKIDSTNPLHWTGAFQNWNSRCASCHSTNLQKNYSLSTNTYNTTWSEINVSCESCHGQGSQHIDWANGNTDLANRGLINSIDAIWSPAGVDQIEIENYVEGLDGTNSNIASTQKEVCASCHSRRSEMAHRDLGSGFLDQHRLTMLSDGLYHADGQIQDEVYVYGSFLQSKMHQSQVSCSNCHEPHTQQLVIQGNGLCLQCHIEQQFDTEEHFFHEPDSEGAQCINCHMPVTTYMGVDDRRDHSFRIPDPFFSLISDAPNACTKCHQDRDNVWAAESLNSITGKAEPYYRHAEIFERVRNNDPFVLPDLLSLMQDESLPAIIRATALLESEQFPSQEVFEVSSNALQSSDPLIRGNAVASVSYLPVPNRYQLLQPLIEDPVKYVRLEVARQLAELPLQQLPEIYANQLLSLYAEFIEASEFNADMPGTMTDLALFYINRGDYVAAESSLDHALLVSSEYLPAILNLADLYRMLERENEGEILLQRAIESYPDSADTAHALGLLYIRAQRMDLARDHLETAFNLAPDNARYVLVYVLALERLGEIPEAVRVLREAVIRFPSDNQLYELLRDYSRR
jgi:tetratricopeptide (TPR) repeat protein